MNLSNSTLPSLFFFYPLGNTPPVCLTQDLPPEQDADILLLGCGDARNLLFTCFIDKLRKIDVTCCDIEPGIHARNILLYSLLIDDDANLNIERIWNIYYNWKIDKDSFELLELQTQKLLKMSESMDQWLNSVYGLTIRFCDEASLTSIRRVWSGFTTQGLSQSQRKIRRHEIQAAFDKAKAFQRNKNKYGNSMETFGLLSMSPVPDISAAYKLSEALDHWRNNGFLPMKCAPARKPTEINPTFFFSVNKSLMLHYSLSPLQGFPLNTVRVPVSKDSTLFCKSSLSPNDNLSIEVFVECAKSHFSQWASAFRRSVANKLVVRIFSGDALAFGLTLRNSQLTKLTSMNLFCNSRTSRTLNLNHQDYGHNRNAPVSFDVVDTSNLCDHLGSLNVIPVGASLLKHHACSILYSETLLKRDSHPADQFFYRCMSLMLGLVSPDLCTNATNLVDNDMFFNDLMKTHLGETAGSMTQTRSRFRWRQIGCHLSSNAPNLHIEAEALAQFLVRVYNVMFEHEDPPSLMSLVSSGNPFTAMKEMSKRAYPAYNRASFAFLLSHLKTSIVTNWDDCIEKFYDKVLYDFSFGSVKSNYRLELLLNMHTFGVDNGKFQKPTAAEISSAILAPVLPGGKDVPSQLCVTMRVRRECLRIFTKNKEPWAIGTPTLICKFDGQDPFQWLNTFSSIQVVFGKWHGETKEDGSIPFIIEDSAGFFGASDMFVSVMVPTVMLLISKRFVPFVNCGVLSNPQNTSLFMKELGIEMNFARSEMTSEDVFITRFMPGVPALPSFTSAIEQRRLTLATTTIQLSDDRSKIDCLVNRITLEPEAARKMALQSTEVKVEFKSPMTAIVNIAGSVDVKVEFPVPVSTLNPRVRVARKSGYIEVEARLFNPLEKNAELFFFPTILIQNPSGKTIPAPWTATQVNLDAMPQIDLKNKESLSWLNILANQMFSAREVHNRISRTKNDIRTEMKDGLFSLLMQYTGLQGQKIDMFSLSKKPGSPETLIFPSCLRLDLASYNVVLDCVLIPLTEATRSDEDVIKLLQELTKVESSQIIVSEAENRAWNALMPALVERCRTWEHTPSCEYLKVGEVPLPKGLTGVRELSICSCGMGKLPTKYLEDQKKRLSALNRVLKRHATRAAISPIFAVQYVEDCATAGLMMKGLDRLSIGTNVGSQERCRKCGRGTRKNDQAGQQSLLNCSRCKKVKYCSAECQKADWKNHKPLCRAA